jgi:hypothetical protein
MVRELPAIVHDRVCLSLTDEIAQIGERIIFPLSDDGVSVNALLGAERCDWLHDLEFDPYVCVLGDDRRYRSLRWCGHRQSRWNLCCLVGSDGFDRRSWAQFA